MRYQHGITFVAGEESRFVVSSRPFAAIRRYSEYLTTSNEPVHAPVGSNNTGEASHLPQKLDENIKIKSRSSAVIPENHHHDVEELKHDEAVVGNHVGSAGPDVVGLDSRYDDELTDRLQQFDELTDSLRSEAAFFENVYLYRAYVDRAEYLFRAYLSRDISSPAEKLPERQQDSRLVRGDENDARCAKPSLCDFSPIYVLAITLPRRPVSTGTLSAKDHGRETA